MIFKKQKYSSEGHVAVRPGERDGTRKTHIPGWRLKVKKTL